MMSVPPDRRIEDEALTAAEEALKRDHPEVWDKIQRALERCQPEALPGLYHVTRVTPLPKYRLNVEFEDGTAGTIDLTDKLTGVFDPLRDEALFREVTIDKHGAVCWPNGLDLAPDAMYRDITGNRDHFPCPSEPR